MPLYEMKCPHCDHAWEVRCKFDELDLLKYSICHQCSQPAERQIAQTSPPQFKGGGFYATDYGRKTK